MRLIETQNDIEEGLQALQSLDPRLIALVADAGEVPLRRREPNLSNLFRIVVSQQVSVQSAASIWLRFEAAFDAEDAKALLDADEKALRAVGLSRPKVKTVKAISEAVLENGLNCKKLAMFERDTVIEKLTSIHGVGPWTAEIFLLFCIGDADVFPLGDIALQQAVMDGFDLPERPKGDDLRAISNQWSPWRGVAARLLWAYYGKMRENRKVLPV